MSELGCSTITFRMLDRAEALDRIAAAGFRAVDLGLIARFCPHANPVSATADDHKRMADELAARGLRASTCNAWSLTALNRPEGPDEEVAYLKASIRMAAALGCHAVSMQPGRKAPEEAWRDNVRVVTAIINELGLYARDQGVGLVVEAPHMGTLAQTFDQALAFLDSVQQHVGVALDTSHIRNGGQSLPAALDAYGERVRHVHIRDFKNGNIRVTPGDGDIDFGEFFSRMRRLGYTGDFSIELEYEGTTAEQNDVELRRAAAHLRPLLAA